MNVGRCVFWSFNPVYFNRFGPDFTRPVAFHFTYFLHWQWWQSLRALRVPLNRLALHQGLYVAYIGHVYTNRVRIKPFKIQIISSFCIRLSPSNTGGVSSVSNPMRRCHRCEKNQAFSYVIRICYVPFVETNSWYSPVTYYSLWKSMRLVWVFCLTNKS